MVASIDLNADVGESLGRWTLGNDAEVVKSITSANIACGYHAGDPGVMRRTVKLARDNGVAIGAHPGFPDLVGFGRRVMQLSAAEVEDLVLYQVGALAGVAAAEGVRLQHVKPHGALYNMAARDRRVADAVARAVALVDRSLILVGLAGSELVRAGEAAGVRVAREAFADRAYEPDGTLTPRQNAGAVIEDADRAVARTIEMIRNGRVRAVDGSDIRLEADTICTHGDTPGAHQLVRRLRAALDAAGIAVRPLAAVLAARAQ